MPQLLEEALQLADAFKNGQISIEEPTVATPVNAMTNSAAIASVAAADTQTNDALKDMSQLLLEANDLSDAFARGEIRFEEQKESDVTVNITNSAPIAPVAEDDTQTNDALTDMSQLLLEANDLSDAFARGEIRFEEQVESNVSITNNEPVAQVLENKDAPQTNSALIDSLQSDLMKKK